VTNREIEILLAVAQEREYVSLPVPVVNNATVDVRAVARIPGPVLSID
jgi:hypothetical protein